MGIVIGIAAIGFLFGVWLAIDDGDGWWAIPRGIFGALIGALIGFFLSMFFSAIPPTKYELSKEIELVSLRHGENSVRGSFFLGCGSVESNPSYIYYVSVGPDIYQMKTIKVTDSVFVYEEDRTDGVLKVYAKKFANKSYNWLSDESLLEGEERYEFHIPKGSILRDFSL